ncbi:hypothetical protein Poly30_50630 [Planctomycetes bacterium Poly30]|uniref:Uncharacterized protein n=1 Tax=Saltatorellus ferox TaxID=2528018 RepID=A0A518EZI3_9BACT|nr:hypothetical protein Poly30_50630 [Planctomycetes bacterium Poly30]
MASAAFLALFPLVERRTQRLSWALSLARADEAIARLEVQSYERPALWGKLEEGSAFEAYEEALALLLGTEAAERKRRSGEIIAMFDLAAVTGVTPAMAEFMADPRTQASLAALRRGAHCRDARPDIDWRGLIGDRRGFGGEFALMMVAHGEARIAAANGDPVAAARWILDAGQLGLDRARIPHTSDRSAGLNVVRHALHGLADGPATRVDLGEEGKGVWIAGIDEAIRQIDAFPPLTDGLYVVMIARGLAIAEDLDPGNLDRGGGSSELVSVTATVRRAIEEIEAASAISRGHGERANASLRQKFLRSDSGAASVVMEIQHAEAECDEVRGVLADVKADLER